MQTKTVRRPCTATGGTLIEHFDEQGRRIKVEHFAGKVYTGETQDVNKDEE